MEQTPSDLTHTEQRIEIPATVPRVRTPAPLTPKDLKADAYKVERITVGGDMHIRLDDARGHSIYAHGAKDPHEQDPNSPAYMTVSEREQWPLGIRFSTVLDKHTVAILLEDPESSKHFTFEPL